MDGARTIKANETEPSMATCAAHLCLRGPTLINRLHPTLHVFMTLADSSFALDWAQLTLSQWRSQGHEKFRPHMLLCIPRFTRVSIRQKRILRHDSVFVELIFRIARISEIYDTRYAQRPKHPTRYPPATNIGVAQPARGITSTKRVGRAPPNNQ